MTSLQFSLCFLYILINLHFSRCNICTSSTDCQVGQCCRMTNGQINVKPSGRFGFHGEEYGRCMISTAALGEICDLKCLCQAGHRCEKLSGSNSSMCVSRHHTINSHSHFSPLQIPAQPHTFSHLAYLNAQRQMAHQIALQNMAANMQAQALAAAMPLPAFKQTIIVEGQNVQGVRPRLKLLNQPSPFDGPIIPAMANHFDEEKFFTMNENVNLDIKETILIEPKKLEPLDVQPLRNVALTETKDIPIVPSGFIPPSEKKSNFLENQIKSISLLDEVDALKDNFDPSLLMTTKSPITIIEVSKKHTFTKKVPSVSSSKGRDFRLNINDKFSLKNDQKAIQQSGLFDSISPLKKKQDAHIMLSTVSKSDLRGIDQTDTESPKYSNKDLTRKVSQFNSLDKEQRKKPMVSVDNLPHINVPGKKVSVRSNMKTEKQQKQNTSRNRSVSKNVKQYLAPSDKHNLVESGKHDVTDFRESLKEPFISSNSPDNNHDNSSNASAHDKSAAIASLKDLSQQERTLLKPRHNSRVNSFPKEKSKSKILKETKTSHTYPVKSGQRNSPSTGKFSGNSNYAEKKSDSTSDYLENDITSKRFLTKAYKTETSPKTGIQKTNTSTNNLNRKFSQLGSQSKQRNSSDPINLKKKPTLKAISIQKLKSNTSPSILQKSKKSNTNHSIQLEHKNLSKRTVSKNSVTGTNEIRKRSPIKYPYNSIFPRKFTRKEFQRSMRNHSVIFNQNNHLYQQSISSDSISSGTKTKPKILPIIKPKINIPSLKLKEKNKTVQLKTSNPSTFVVSRNSNFEKFKTRNIQTLQPDVHKSYQAVIALQNKLPMSPIGTFLNGQPKERLFDEKLKSYSNQMTHKRRMDNKRTTTIISPNLLQSSKTMGNKLNESRLDNRERTDNSPQLVTDKSALKIENLRRKMISIVEATTKPNILILESGSTYPKDAYTKFKSDKYWIDENRGNKVTPLLWIESGGLEMNSVSRGKSKTSIAVNIINNLSSKSGYDSVGVNFGSSKNTPMSLTDPHTYHTDSSYTEITRDTNTAAGVISKGEQDLIGANLGDSKAPIDLTGTSGDHYTNLFRRETLNPVNIVKDVLSSKTQDLIGANLGYSKAPINLTDIGAHHMDSESLSIVKGALFKDAKYLIRGNLSDSIAPYDLVESGSHNVDPVRNAIYNLVSTIRDSVARDDTNFIGTNNFNATAPIELKNIESGTNNIDTVGEVTNKPVSTVKIVVTENEEDPQGNYHGNSIATTDWIEPDDLYVDSGHKVTSKPMDVAKDFMTQNNLGIVVHEDIKKETLTNDLNSLVEESFSPSISNLVKGVTTIAGLGKQELRNIDGDIISQKKLAEEVEETDFNQLQGNERTQIDKKTIDYENNTIEEDEKEEEGNDNDESKESVGSKESNSEESEESEKSGENKESDESEERDESEESDESQESYESQGNLKSQESDGSKKINSEESEESGENQESDESQESVGSKESNNEKIDESQGSDESQENYESQESDGSKESNSEESEESGESKESDESQESVGSKESNSEKSYESQGSDESQENDESQESDDSQENDESKESEESDEEEHPKEKVQGKDENTTNDYVLKDIVLNNFGNIQLTKLNNKIK